MDNETDPSQPSVSKFTPTEGKSGRKSCCGPQRHTLLVGGSRSGKTTLLVHEIADRARRCRRLAPRHPAVPRQCGARLDRARHVAEGVSPLASRRSRSSSTAPRATSRSRTSSEIWIGGLDDQERVEKILGKEYATIFLNECSQIPYSSVLVALTRLAQVVGGLTQAAYYDLNPTSKGHWTNVLFGEKRDPISRLPLDDPDDYARMFLNPRDNADNLSTDYLKSLERLPERQRKRFFEGVYIDDLDGALFSYEMIARTRVAEFAPARRRRVVVAVDPSGAAGRDDERRRRDRHRRRRQRRRRPRLRARRPLAARCAGGVGPRRGRRPITSSRPTASSPRRISAARWCASSSAPPTPMRRCT